MRIRWSGVTPHIGGEDWVGQGYPGKSIIGWGYTSEGRVT